MKVPVILAISILILSLSCEKDEIIVPPIDSEEPVQILHISHTKTPVNPIIDPVIEGIDFDKYEVLMLGGDLASETTDNLNTLGYVDSIYNLGSENTLWSPGNHDYSYPIIIQNATNRPTFYAHHKDGITYLVLDTELDSCRITGAQLDLFNSVTDTIQESSHLIVMTHKLIWMYGNSHLEPSINTISNGYLGTNNWELNPNNFYPYLYYKLDELQDQGVEIICIAGDIGTNAKEFSYRTNSGIQFLASGIESGESGNKGLVFNHFKESRKLTWRFVDIKDL